MPGWKNKLEKLFSAGEYGAYNTYTNINISAEEFVVLTHTSLHALFIIPYYLL